MSLPDLIEASGKTDLQIAYEIGAGQNTVYCWRRGIYVPSLKLVPALAKCIGAPPAAIRPDVAEIFGINAAAE